MSETAQQDAAHAPMGAAHMPPARRSSGPGRGRPPAKGFRVPRGKVGPLQGLTARAQTRQVRAILEYAAMGESVPGWQIGAACKLLEFDSERRELRRRVRDLEAELARVGKGPTAIQIVFAGGFGGQAPAIDGESVALPRGLDVHKP